MKKGRKNAQRPALDTLADLFNADELADLTANMPDLSHLFTDDDMAVLAELSASVAEPGEPRPLYFDIDELLHPGKPPRRRKPRQQRRRAR